MRSRVIGGIVFGIAGFGVLMALGTWQVHRLHWKEALLADIEARIAAAPVALPAQPDPGTDRYRAVSVAGRFEGAPLRVQSALDGFGAGYRIIQAFDTDGAGRLLVDRGFVPQGDLIAKPPEGEVTITGNLLWPDESDSFTPRPDLKTGLFYARDVAAMARVLQARPLLLVRREGAGGGGSMITLPVGTAGIPNDHKGYAITWFALAAIWLVMSAGLIYRMRKQGKGDAA